MEITITITVTSQEAALCKSVCFRRILNEAAAIHHETAAQEPELDERIENNLQELDDISGIVENLRVKVVDAILRGGEDTVAGDKTYWIVPHHTTIAFVCVECVTAEDKGHRTTRRVEVSVHDAEMLKCIRCDRCIADV